MTNIILNSNLEKARKYRDRWTYESGYPDKLVMKCAKLYEAVITDYEKTIKDLIDETIRQREAYNNLHKMAHFPEVKKDQL